MAMGGNNVLSARGPALEVVLSGELACFTRPEMKVERVSYPVMTPSAARGAIEAIFWKPEIRWRIREISVLRPIQYFSFVRNEVNSRQSERAARGWAADGGGYNAQSDRAQRHTLALRDVSYLVRADVELCPGVLEDVAKYRDQFRRRVKRGQCFSRPYLGCREFAAEFRGSLPDDHPIELNDDLGPMLLDVIHKSGSQARPIFFDARLSSGVLRIPSFPESEEVT